MDTTLSGLMDSGTAPSFQTAPTLAVDLNEAAGLLGVSVTTIRREINRGNLLSLRIGRVFRIRVAELHAYLKRAEIRQNPTKN